MFARYGYPNDLLARLRRRRRTRGRRAGAPDLRRRLAIGDPRQVGDPADPDASCFGRSFAAPAPGCAARRARSAGAGAGRSRRADGRRRPDLLVSALRRRRRGQLRRRRRPPPDRAGLRRRGHRGRRRPGRRHPRPRGRRHGDPHQRRSDGRRRALLRRRRARDARAARRSRLAPGRARFTAALCREVRAAAAALGRDRQPLAGALRAVGDRRRARAAPPRHRALGRRRAARAVAVRARRWRAGSPARAPSWRSSARICAAGSPRSPVAAWAASSRSCPMRGSFIRSPRPRAPPRAAAWVSRGRPCSRSAAWCRSRDSIS